MIFKTSLSFLVQLFTFQDAIVLESLVLCLLARLNSYTGWTNKFIFPPYDFSIANSMITNFHSPKSTLMMMAAAFAGYDFLMEAYKVAVKEEYKFHTYGDAMLII
jgi:S-adenosylmethionine:tRNA ribosyltransferase-isomerase